MTETVFLAGGSGAVGQQNIPLLIEDGWRVVATTQSTAKFALLQKLGAEPIVMDAFDAKSVMDAVMVAKPSVIIHQLTSLPDGLAPELMAAARERNAQIRDVGTRNLVAAAKAAGVKRMVSQSIAWAYAPGKASFSEDDPLDASQWGVKSLEDQTLAGPFDGIVLRYGYFYGPGTGFDFPTRPGSLHVADAAQVAAHAARKGAPGRYNVAEEDGPFNSAKAQAELNFQPRQHDS